MAAHDPAARRAAASTAARARLTALDDAGRREMTAQARETLRRRDLKTVDDWARRVGRRLTEIERQKFAADFARARAVRASKAAAQARTLRARTGAGSRVGQL